MSGLLHSLGIDWRLLIAQVVNFAVLVFVLKKFAYRPILEVLRARREKITKSAAERIELEKERAAAAAAREETLRDARTLSEKIVRESEQAAAKRREEIVSEAKREGEQLMISAKKEIASQKEALLREVKKEIGALVALAVEKSMASALDAENRRRLVEEAVALIREEENRV